MATWDDIKQESLIDPYLHSLVTIVEHSILDRESALIDVCLSVSRERRHILDSLIDSKLKSTMKSEDQIRTALRQVSMTEDRDPIAKVSEVLKWVLGE